MCRSIIKGGEKILGLVLIVMNNKENIKTLIIKKPLKLDCGQTINDYPLAYETYGSLNENKDNAI